MKRQIDKLVKLEAYRWHELTMKMAWVFRTGGKREIPPLILAVFKGVPPDKEAWAELRKRVNAKRKAQRAEEARYIRRRRIEGRRAYMRKYMRDYRAGRRRQA